MNLIRGSKFFLPIAVVVFTVAIIAMLNATKPEVEEEKNEFPPLVVEVHEATLTEVVRSSFFQGEVRAKTSIDLVTQVAGKVVQVSDKFTEGGRFDAGEALINIDSADYLVAVRSAEAAVAEAKVQLDIERASAATNASEWEKLQGRSIDEANPLRLNKPQVDRARARLKAAQAELALARLNLERTTVSAPFSGRIMTKEAELGQFLSRGSSIGRVFASDEMEVRIPMTDTQVADLGLVVGQSLAEADAPKATISTKFGSKTHYWPGKLRSIDASIDNDTRLLYATVVADKVDESSQQSMPLAPGLFVDVELQAGQPVAGVQVPRTALRNGNRIYVVDDGKLRFHEVKTVFTSSEVAIIESGNGSPIQGTEIVVMSPVPGAYEGMAVKIKDDVENLNAPVMETV
ncbi:MAG: efflux RND transporter periplasmic adaptor subunit [Arenicella sp.]|nr:efflux RND transporter periplasmic adaptor subunit [Arenicella sp.]